MRYVYLHSLATAGRVERDDARTKEVAMALEQPADPDNTSVGDLSAGEHDGEDYLRPTCFGPRDEEADYDGDKHFLK